MTRLFTTIAALTLPVLFASAVSAQQAAPTARPATTSAAAAPQPASVTVKGQIIDFLTEEPIEGASIVLINEKNKQQRLEVETKADGIFELKVQPGDWLITISKEGMFVQSEKLKLAANETVNKKFALEELEATDVMRVTGKRTLVHPENIGSSTDIGRKMIQEYKSGNDLKDLITSTPGIVRDSFGNIITRGEHNAINYELDGVVLPEAANTLTQSQFASPRALQSMQVDIGGYQASDGGGPLGAVVRMKSLPIQSKPTITVGGQIGGPIGGNLNYYASSALSQNQNSLWNRVRIESVGSVTANSYGIEPYVRNYVRNGRCDMNFLNKIEFTPTEKDKFKLTIGINDSYLGLPTPGISKRSGVRMNQQDRSDFVIASYQRKGERFFDDLNLHIVNAFYSSRLRTTNVFDPRPNLVGEEPFLASTAAQGSRFNYAFSAQGDVSKRAFNTHNLKAGFYSEIRPVKTKLNAIYFNADPNLTTGGDEEAGIPGTPVPIGTLISPFTRNVGGPSFIGDIGRYRGFRYLQSAFFQDTWRPQKGFWQRLTVDAGVRADIYHGVFGDTLPVAGVMSTIPGIAPFLSQPFQKQRITQAQASGRFGGSFVLTKNTVVRGSFANIFQPPPVDIFSTPPVVDEGPINGIYNGTLRPLRPTTGHLVDCSVEQQIGPRLVTRTNFYYKKLKNFGDSGVVQNTPLYNRLTLSNQESYGLESRVELRPSRDGTGFWGFLSNTVQVTLLRGSKGVTGGIYEIEGPVFLKYPDHDRRYQLATGLGYRAKNGVWALSELNVWTGLPDRRDPSIFGAHPARTPVLTFLGINAGYNFPEKKDRNRLMPTSVDVRLQNVLNQRLPINLGSPYQGNRYALPIRVLVGMYWKV